MNTNRRKILALSAAMALLPHRMVNAQSTQLKLVVGYSAGGAIDLVARAIGEGLREAGYNAIVENKAGAAGRMAIETIVNGSKTGETLLMAPLSALTLHPHVFKSLRYDPMKDLVPVAGVASMSFGLAVPASMPVRTLQDFLSLAAKNPDMAAFATPGTGSVMHFIGSLLSREAKVPLTHIPYKGGSAAINDVIAGVTPSVLITTPALEPMQRAGKIRILATTDTVPNKALPGVPSFKSAGFPDLDQQEVFALFVSAGTPQPIVAKLQKAAIQAVNSPKVISILEKNEYKPVALDAAALRAQLDIQYKRWGQIVKDSGYAPE